MKKKGGNNGSRWRGRGSSEFPRFQGLNERGNYSACIYADSIVLLAPVAKTLNTIGVPAILL